MEALPLRPTQAIIHLPNIAHNLALLKAQLSESTHLMAVVKAEAYGHGMVPIARYALNHGAAALGVAQPEEGALLRASGIDAPILVLGVIDPNQAELVAAYGLAQTVSSTDILPILQQQATAADIRIPLHLKLDTGMGRIGLREPEEVGRFMEALDAYPRLFLEGVFTHFASADGEDPAYTHRQIDRFQGLLSAVKQHRPRPFQVHASNSAGLLRFPQAHYDMVRAGIALYGYDPSGTPRGITQGLLPVLRWVTRIVHLKTLEAGESVSYGCTYTASKPVRVATLPVGYADGYRRALSNRGHVLVGGRKAPILGRVCMDQTMVDVTGILEADLGSEAVLIGAQGSERVNADELADLCDTISYEILTGISERVPRVYTK